MTALERNKKLEKSLQVKSKIEIFEKVIHEKQQITFKFLRGS